MKLAIKSKLNCDQVKFNLIHCQNYLIPENLFYYKVLPSELWTFSEFYHYYTREFIFYPDIFIVQTTEIVFE